MATYYHGNSEIQGGGDGLHTLILMNHAGYVGYSDNQQQQQQQSPPSNFVFLNSNTPGGGGGGGGFPHAPPQSHTQQFVGIPLTTTASASAATAVTTSQDHHQHQQDISAFHGFFPRPQYNLYSPTMDLGAARDISRAQQSLSLSLSSQQPGYGSFRSERELPSQPLAATISPTSGGGEDVRVSGGSSSSASGISNGLNGMQSVILSSKYLKVAQELLDEVVSVGKGMKNLAGAAKGDHSGQPNDAGESSDAAAAAAAAAEIQSGGKRGAELSTAERQEIQMKKGKLVNMLDEVEQRYRQYHHQMQIVISWFEQAVGIGSAKTYTALALQTISKQFRCLKDAILGQIRAASRSLGEEDNLGGKIEGSRLKFVDNQLRQQRALQQLGMIQHNAWRPQRGLPERSVSVLRAWLFEHFLHPYPKDSDKIMLAKQTGLTRSQVSNWFINARVRLWKPMVEEMYMEEVKENEKNGGGGGGGGSDEKLTKHENQQNEESGSKSMALEDKSSILENQQNRGFMKTTQDHFANQNNITSPVTISASIQNQPGFNLIGSPEMDSIAQASPKKLRGPEMDTDSNPDHLSMKFQADRQGREGFSLLGAPTNFIGGFGSYPMAEIGRFGSEQFPGPYSGNGVSLTLGLPHCENLSISGSHHHQNFMPNQNIQLGRGVEMGEPDEYGGLSTPTSGHSTSVYETINIQNRKRFAAQLLPDFVT